MLLSPYRVLDLSDERGQLAGMMLADLGAEVILVEPADGSRSRRLGPFVEGRDDDPEASLWFWSYNRGKRSITLDVDDPADQARLKKLVEGADVVIESDAPGVMAARGLGPDDLLAINPALVMVSVSAFGQTGPKADWAATDITVVASSMHMSVMGDEDRAPLRIPLDQAFLHASADAAVSVLIALFDRSRSGLGQHIDVSAQQALTAALQSTTLNTLYNAMAGGRMSGGAKLGPFEIRLRSPASDGYVSTTILFGEAIGPFSQRLFEWIHAGGGCEDSDLEIDWVNFVENITTGKLPMGEYARIQEVAAQHTATLTKAHLLEEALEKRLLMVPVANVADVAEAEHYAVRDFWRDIEIGESGSVRFPGPMAKLSGTPLDITTAPPTIGEGNDELLPAAPRAIAASSVGGLEADRDPNGQPLAGLKILDLQWVMAGPAATRPLADWGATIVRVESANRIETARTIQPFLNDEGGADNSGLYNNMNAGKLGLTLDLSKPESHDVIFDLVRWADVVCESFSPKAMRNWGLSYEDLAAVNPSIIMTSSCLFGQDGPLSSLAGFGTMGASMSGFYEMTGWPDRDPAGVFGAYTDYVSPRFLSAAILAAVEHRDRTGEGQYIDLSQAEAGMHFLTPALLDYNINGRMPSKLGNSHPAMCPHAAYPSAGDDKWIAVSCETDDQWRSLCGVIGLEGHDDLSLEQRMTHDEIDAAITAWTSERSGNDGQSELQAAGVPAHRIQDVAELTEDPQIVHRRHFREGAHATNGTMWVEGPRYSMSRSTDKVENAGPSHGQHTFEVLEEILGYDGDRIAELAVAGVLE